MDIQGNPQNIHVCPCRAAIGSWPACREAGAAAFILCSLPAEIKAAQPLAMAQLEQDSSLAKQLVAVAEEILRQRLAAATAAYLLNRQADEVV